MKKTFTRLTDTQIQTKVNFIDQYINSTNAASGSTVDQNANVSSKNIATLEAELNKDINIQVNRKLVYNKLIKLFDKEIADEYIRQLESHEMNNQNEPYFTLPSGMITHNCRLRNDITDNTFSYSLGAGGVATGSINVITINMNRLIQDKRDLKQKLKKYISIK